MLYPTKRSLTSLYPPPPPVTPQEVMGLNLGKPAPVETPEDYVYEQFIPDTPMTRKFGHLRGAKIKTVSETVADFYTYVSCVVLLRDKRSCTSSVASSVAFEGGRRLR